VETLRTLFVAWERFLSDASEWGSARTSTEVAGFGSPLATNPYAPGSVLISTASHARSTYRSIVVAIVNDRDGAALYRSGASPTSTLVRMGRVAVRNRDGVVPAGAATVDIRCHCGKTLRHAVRLNEYELSYWAGKWPRRRALHGVDRVTWKDHAPGNRGDARRDEWSVKCPRCHQAMRGRTGELVELVRRAISAGAQFVELPRKFGTTP